MKTKKMSSTQWYDQSVLPDKKWSIYADETKIMTKLKDSVIYQ